MLTVCVIILSVSVKIILSEDSPNQTVVVTISKNCRDRNRPINSENGDLYAIIDATKGAKLTLMCHYCSENDDGRPKVWYKNYEIGRSNETKEVDLGMENNSAKNRIYTTPEHSLVISKFTENDTGVYFCKRTEYHEKAEKYNYLVELVNDMNVTSVETGNLTAWKRYYEDYFAPVNKMFAESRGTEFVFLRDLIKIKLELVTQWDPYGVCEVCGRPQGHGMRKKKGYCRMKLTRQVEIDKTGLNSDELYISSVNAISCRSTIFERKFPGISNLTKIIPNFIMDERCEGICNPGQYNLIFISHGESKNVSAIDAEGVNAGWKMGKAKGFKYRKRIVLEEHDHLAVVCPESTLENTVIWKRNGHVLAAGKGVPPEIPHGEPRIIVDTFNTLYLVNVKSTEAGNYTCQVDDVKMQQLIVYIASKSRFLTYELVRHFMYLGFILALTTTCYVAGLIITCYKRDTFKDYEELREIHAKEDETDLDV